MNRLKLLATATLVALAFTACDEGTPPPVEPPPPPTPVGTISGSVTIDGTAASGITATLSSGATQTTGAGGNFAFPGVEAGTYTVTISGFPEDATFAQVTQSATIATDGQNVQLNFAGEYIRSSAVVGNVVAADAMMSGGDGQPETLAGVTVTLDGEHAMGETMETAMDGGFAFTGLRAGTYTVTISDFPEDVSFETVSVEVEIDVGEIGNADFTGHYIRTSAVEGQVIIDSEGLQGVTVTLAGGPADESFTTMTDVDGMYRFEDLRPGDYTVSISDFDARDYEFAATSQDVSVDLDDTRTVSFTGVLLRTSGISGRVSVEGMGLGDISVTLSGAADASTTTDAGGQYAFAGLAAGDYTVTIAVASDAYVFDSMSQDVTVGDDESAIVPFEGQHARTARVSGMAFIDELDKNNEQDAGEDALAQAGIPVALVGPGVNDQRLSATGPDGSFSFSGLRAGSYQLVVPIDATVAAALAANDVAYGGPGTGYAFALGVGERKIQAVPFDITHTTVNFSVSLRSGDEKGEALPDASVSLYGANSAMVGSGMTGADGSVAIKVARAMTSGNMVNAGVSADGYDVADGMTAVSWDPQMFATSGENANDIVNLNVNVNVSGATVMTDYGGGEALAGWAISVMMGDAAVEGAPTMLGDDGSVPFTTTVASVPASFTFTAADDQDDELDGGEMYEASGGAYTHTGLKLAGAMDADPIVVTYTTQTLKVYVHEELDQVRGYTGNVGHGDVRMSGLVDLEIRQATGNDGRFTSAISNDDWDAGANSVNKNGEYTFSHLPADMDIVVHATARDGYKLLDLHGLDAYRNMDENGVMGGAFGAMGGWGHTVTLCPLTEVEPTGQDFGKCGSFAVVSLHNVSGLVWMKSVATSGTDFKITDPKFVAGTEVSLTPVEGKNLGGVGASFTTAKSDDKTTADIDERVAFEFDAMAAGAYALGLPDGWRAKLGGKGSEVDLGSALSPLAGSVALDITPSTTSLYGFVRDQSGFGLKGLSVDVNGMTVTTDDLGRYVASGIASAAGKINVSIARAGYPTTKDDTTFVANMPTQLDITVSGANNTVAITGTVTESGTGAGIKGVEIKVDGSPPLNATKGKLTTGDDGTYAAIVEVQPFNDPLVNVSASKKGYHFLPEVSPVAAIAGASPTANFEGRAAVEIVGRVTAPGGGMPKAEVTVTAYSDAAMTTKLDDVTTTETGTFSLFVDPLSGTVYLGAAPQDDYTPADPNYVNLSNAEMYNWFDPPANRPGGSIAVIPGQTLQFGTFKGYSVQPRITSVSRGTVKTDTATIAPLVPQLVKGEPTDSIVVKWEFDTRNLSTNAADPSFSVASGATLSLGGIVTAAAPTATAPAAYDGDADRTAGSVANGTSSTHKRTSTHGIPVADLGNYGERKITIAVDVIGADGTVAAAAATSASMELAAVDGSIRSLEVDRDVDGGTGENDPVTDEISATWFGPGSPGLQHRIALYVPVDATESTWEWVVFGAAPAQPAITRATAIPGDTGSDWGQWSSADFNLNLDANATGWADDDSTDTYALTVDDLRKATHLRVDTRVDGDDWVKHTPATIPAG